LVGHGIALVGPPLVYVGDGEAGIAGTLVPPEDVDALALKGRGCGGQKMRW
jgi:hypothetical protein